MLQKNANSLAQGILPSVKIMNNVVNIQKRIESRKQKEQLEQYRGKTWAIQKVIQCSSCHFKCAMCGLHFDMKDSSNKPAQSLLGFTFCESCREEYKDFLSISRGENQPDVFWHNKEWLHMWSAWLNYRQAITNFTDSDEFKLLLEELNKQS